MMVMMMTSFDLYAKHFEYNNKTVSFKAIDKKLLKMYTQIWERVSNLININFNSEPAYVDNDKNTSQK